MISVIIPTLWKVNFLNQINLLLDLNAVKEIIVINNDKTVTPEWFSSLNNDKIVEVKVNKNIFVNPAWNMGVRLAKYNNIFLNSDDVILDSYDFLQTIDDILMIEDCLIGCSKSCYEYKLSNDLVVVDENGDRPFGYGCMMFFKKDTFKPIPEEFKVWYGDEFLYQRYKNKRKAKSITNINMSKTGLGATTPFVLDICKKDDEIGFQNYLSSYLKD
jgi:hypothetical protein